MGEWRRVLAWAGCQDGGGGGNCAAWLAAYFLAGDTAQRRFKRRTLRGAAAAAAARAPPPAISLTPLPLVLIPVVLQRPLQTASLCNHATTPNAHTTSLQKHTQTEELGVLDTARNLMAAIDASKPKPRAGAPPKPRKPRVSPGGRKRGAHGDTHTRSPLCCRAPRAFRPAPPLPALPPLGLLPNAFASSPRQHTFVLPHTDGSCARAPRACAAPRG